MSNFKDVPDNYFEEDNFTVSYNIDTGFWYSFHDYIGNFRFSMRNQNVYSFFNNTIYRHNQNNYGKFYGGIIKKSYITPTFNPQPRKDERLYAFILNSLNYSCDFFDKFRNKLLQKTITSISLHNSYQSTSEIFIKSIDPTETLKSQWDNINVRFVRNAWFFNKIKDETDNTNLATLNEKFDEVISNVRKVNCERKKRIFVDDFAIAKLTYDNKDQLEMSFSEINFDITLVKI